MLGMFREIDGHENSVEFLDESWLLALPDGEDGTGRQTYDLFRYTSEDEVSDSTPAVRAEDDEIDILLSGVFQNDRSRRITSALDRDDLDLVWGVRLEHRGHLTLGCFLELPMQSFDIDEVELRLVVEAMQDHGMEHVELGLILLGQIKSMGERLFSAWGEISRK
jgi:hypothetical protein